MANVKISALPITTATTLNDVFVKNNSGETITNKVLVKNALGLTSGTGVDSIKSASFLSSTPAQSTGNASVAIGNDSEAKADNSTALGNRAECFDNIRVNSTAIGAFTRVAQYSTAVGNSVTSVGAASTAMGSNVSATGSGDVAIGKDVTCNGSNSVVIGYNASTNSSDSVSIGNDADVITAQSGIAIGKAAQTTANYAIAIGFGTVADLPNSVALGYNVNTKFSGATATAGLDTNGNVTDTFYNTPNVANTFNVNFNLSSTQKCILTANSTVALTNIRNGGRYRILFENTGAFDITAITGTLESGGTPNIYYNGGGRDPLTHNSKVIWYIDIFQSEIFVTQFLNYTT